MSQSTGGKSKKWTVQKCYCEKMLLSIGSFPTLNIANLVALIAYEMKSNNDDQPWKTFERSILLGKYAANMMICENTFLPTKQMKETSRITLR